MSIIRMVSRWADSEHELFVRNATQLRAIWLRHVAEDFRIARIHTGLEVGQYEVIISFRGWAAFGHATESVAKDEEFIHMMDASHANGRMISRNFLVEIDLR
jgi:hypothetical protein